MSVKESLNEITISSPHSLRVVQKGNGNEVIAEQSDSVTNLKTSAASGVIEKAGNQIVFKQSGIAGSTEVINSSFVRQSGSGNRVIIKQTGGGNSISVSQSPSKIKEE